MQKWDIFSATSRALIIIKHEYWRPWQPLLNRWKPCQISLTLARIQRLLIIDWFNVRCSFIMYLFLTQILCIAVLPAVYFHFIGITVLTMDIFTVQHKLSKSILHLVILFFKFVFTITKYINTFNLMTKSDI